MPRQSVWRGYSAPRRSSTYMMVISVMRWLRLGQWPHPPDLGSLLTDEAVQVGAGLVAHGLEVEVATVARFIDTKDVGKHSPGHVVVHPVDTRLIRGSERPRVGRFVIDAIAVCSRGGRFGEI